MNLELAFCSQGKLVPLCLLANWRAVDEVARATSRWGSKQAGSFKSGVYALRAKRLIEAYRKLTSVRVFRAMQREYVSWTTLIHRNSQNMKRPQRPLHIKTVNTRENNVSIFDY